MHHYSRPYSRACVGNKKQLIKGFPLLIINRTIIKQTILLTYLLLSIYYLSNSLLFSLSHSLSHTNPCLFITMVHIFFVIIYQKYVTKTLTSTAPNFVIFYYVLLAAFFWGQSLTKINDCDIYFCLINLDIHGHNKSQALYENQFITF